MKEGHRHPFESAREDSPRSRLILERPQHLTAFTIIELLVVVGIIILLVALLIPAVQVAERRSAAVQCFSNERQWGIHWATYLGMHDGRFTEGMDYSGTEIGWHRGEWADSLREYYLGNSKLLMCPVATKPRVDGGVELSYGGPENTYLHGSVAGSTVAVRSSYGINCWLYNPPASVTSIQSRPADLHWRTLAGASRPSRIPLMADMMWRGAGPHYGRAIANQAPAYNGQWLGYDYEIMHVALDRHSGGVNVVFLDGHAEHVRTRRTWRLEWHRNYEVNRAATNTWPTWLQNQTE